MQFQAKEEYNLLTIRPKEYNPDRKKETAKFLVTNKTLEKTQQLNWQSA